MSKYPGVAHVFSLAVHRKVRSHQSEVGTGATELELGHLTHGGQGIVDKSHLNSSH